MTIGHHKLNTDENKNIIRCTPYQCIKLIYNTKKQYPTWSDFSEDQLTISGDICGIYSGFYKAIFTPNKGYKWIDGTEDSKEVIWCIYRENENITLSKYHVVLNPRYRDKININVYGASGQIHATCSESEETVICEVSGTTIQIEDLIKIENIFPDKEELKIIEDTLHGKLSGKLSDDIFGKVHRHFTICVTVEDSPSILLINVLIELVTIYGFYIDNTIEDLYDKVSYLEHAKGKRPVNANHGTSFTYGDWLEDEFFIPKPCMLKYDGKVDYYLKEDDYNIREDTGTYSDISNVGYHGNAMMEWGRFDCKIWMKIVPTNDKKSITIYYADGKFDDSFTCWSFINMKGDKIKHFYTAIYNGSYISKQTRSLSNQKCGRLLCAEDEIEYAKHNNPDENTLIWYNEVLCDHILIMYLLILISKNLDIEKVYGNGYGYDYNKKYKEIEDSYDQIDTGTMNTGGLFCGSSGRNHGVKVFGMENIWGNIWRRMSGIMLIDNHIKYKLTYGKQDGSTEESYNLDGNGYKDGGFYSVNGYKHNILYNNDGIKSKNENEEYCDSYDIEYYPKYLRASLSNIHPLVNGGWIDGKRPNELYVLLYAGNNNAFMGMNSSISCKPYKSDDE